MIELYLALGILGLVYYSKNNETNENKESFVAPIEYLVAPTEDPKAKVLDETKSIKSLTGGKIDIKDFMIKPLDKTRIGNIQDDTGVTNQQDFNSARELNQRILNGDYYCKKKETTPFFNNFKNLSTLNVKKNINDQTQERIYTSKNRKGELPFEQIRVGQGISGQYDSKPQGGFHDPNIRELVKPKTIEELRSLSNPKLQFKGRIISGKKPNNIPNKEYIGEVSKNRPETVFSHGHNRLFKTTGANLKQTMLKKFEAKPTNRQHSKQFIGIAKGDNKQKSDINVQKSRKNNFKNKQPSNKTSSNQWNEKSKLSNYGKESFISYPNERDITQKRTYKSNIVTSFKAIIAPIIDKIKDTKKQEVELNNRPEGNFSLNGPKKMTAYDPNDIARTTIKETTIDNNRKGVADGNNKPTIYKHDTLPKITIRNTLDFVDCNVNLNPVGVNKNKTFSNQPIKTTVKQTTIDNKYIGQQNSENGDGYKISKAKAPNTKRQFYSNTKYKGIADSPHHKPTDHTNVSNASLNINKEVISRGRKPTLSGPKKCIDKSKINTMLKKQMSETKNTKVFKNIEYIKTSSEIPVVLSHSKDTLNNAQNIDRINPEILDVYTKNPYTQSLHSYTNALPVSNEQDSVDYNSNSIELNEDELNRKANEIINTL